MKTIEFRKLFFVPKEGENSFSIITYLDRPYMMNTVKSPDSEHGLVTYVSERRYNFQIDLWLFVVRLMWKREFTIDTAYEN